MNPNTSSFSTPAGKVSVNNTVIIILVALALIFVAVLLFRSKGLIGGTLDGIFSGISRGTVDLLGGVGAGVTGLVGSLLTIPGSIVDSGFNVLSKFDPTRAPAVRSATNRISGHVDAAGSKISTASSRVSGHVQHAGDKIGDTFRRLF